MPTTRPNGTKVPINADAYNLTADLATTGNSANVVIPVANQAARDALTSYPGMTVIRLDLGTVMEIWDGTIWRSNSQTSYSPALTASTTNPNIGSGSVLGTYSIIGKNMIGQFYVTFGSGSTAGSGSYQISLPPGYTYAPLSPYIATGLFVSFGSGGSSISGFTRQGGAANSYLNMYWQSAPTTLSALTNSTFGWASGMYISGSFTVILA